MATIFLSTNQSLYSKIGRAVILGRRRAFRACDGQAVAVFRARQFAGLEALQNSIRIFAGVGDRRHDHAAVLARRNFRTELIEQTGLVAEKPRLDMPAS